MKRLNLEISSSEARKCPSSLFWELTCSDNTHPSPLYIMLAVRKKNPHSMRVTVNTGTWKGTRINGRRMLMQLNCQDFSSLWYMHSSSIVLSVLWGNRQLAVIFYVMYWAHLKEKKVKVAMNYNWCREVLNPENSKSSARVFSLLSLTANCKLCVHVCESLSLGICTCVCDCIGGFHILKNQVSSSIPTVIYLFMRAFIHSFI